MILGTQFNRIRQVTFQSLHTTSYIRVINYIQGWEPVMQGKGKMYWLPNFIPWACPKFYPKVHPLNISGSYYCESLVMVEWFYFYIIDRKLSIGTKMSDITKLFLLAWIAQHLQNCCPSPLLELHVSSALSPFREVWRTQLYTGRQRTLGK